MRIVSAILAFLLACAGITAASTTATAAEDQATRLAIVFPLTVPPQATGLIPADSLEQYTSPTGILTRALAAVDGRQVTVGIDPMIIASIRILGSTAPPSAIEWLNRLAAMPNETFALAYADSDVSALSQAGSNDILAPTWFEIDPGRYPAEPETDEPEGDTASDSSTAEPQPTTPPADPVPTPESLTDWPYTLDSVVWPRSNTVTSGDLETFNALAPVTTILSSDNLAPSVSASASVDDHAVVVAHERLSDLLTTATLAAQTTEWQDVVGQLTAALGARSGTTVLTVDRAASLGAPRLAETLATITEAEGVMMTDLAQTLDEPPVTARIVDKPIDSERISRIRLLLASEALVLQFSTALADPAPLTGERRLALLSLSSNSWVDPTTVWMTTVDQWLARSNEIVNSVQIAESSTLNFFQDRGNLPIAVSNALEYPVTVLVTVRSATGILVVTDSRVPITIEAGSQARATIPVQSIANGEATLRVSLSTDAGVAIGTPKTVTANVVAGWESAVTFALAGLLALLFVAGIVRTVVKSRRARAALASTEGAPAHE